MSSAIRKLSWISIYLIVCLLSVLPFVAKLPLPTQAMEFQNAKMIESNGSIRKVSLPHRWQQSSADGNPVVYEVNFPLASIPNEPIYLFIPNLKRHLQARLNGQLVFDSASRISWAGPLMQISGLALLPESNLQSGNNQLLFQLRAAHPLPSRLSKFYIGSHADVVPYFKQHIWVNERLLAMSYAAQIVLSMGLFAAYSLRRQDTLFAWLGLTVALSSFFGSGLLVDLIPQAIHFYPYVFLLGPSIGASSILFSLSLVGRAEPRYLKLAIPLAPLLLYLITLTGIISMPQIAIMVAMPSLIIGFLVATGIIAFEAWGERRYEVRLILGPWFLIAVYMLHDLILSVGLVSGNSFTNHSVRTLFVILIVIILMRRLSTSLNEVERSEEVLHSRLAEQEADLGENYAKQSVALKQSTIESERQRLISDLHDGMGGHLVSILALAENPQADKVEVQHVAQKALNDLRMVIYSLDMDGGDLSYALALYRQQIDPVLKNLGIEVRWSLLHFPEMEETGPSNVLSVLRILQEALTNAQKHGKPQLITIEGISGPHDTALLIVENSGGVPYQMNESDGYGMTNMQKRAQALGGQIDITPLTDGARLVLQLPLHLSVDEGQC